MNVDLVCRRCGYVVDLIMYVSWVGCNVGRTFLGVCCVCCCGEGSIVIFKGVSSSSKLTRLVVVL